MMYNILNKKGQAASTDALIFLSIVAVVFVFILGYTMNYGSSVMDSANKLYNSNYHYSALKAFMSASYGRDGLDIVKSNAQDSVATMLKEDYGTNSLKLAKSEEGMDNTKLISINTKIAVLQTMSDLFRILPQRSYMLLISHDASIDGLNHLVPLILFLHTFDYDGYNPIPKSFVCYPDSESIEKYLKEHTIGLEVAEGNFMLYRNILSRDEAYKSSAEQGSIFLASWISSVEEVSAGYDFKISLNCEDYTNILDPSQTN